MITKERKELLNELMEVLGYKFKDLELLNLAFVHRSYLNECKDATISNERLEFLGDVILGFIVSVELYEQFPNSDEGYLTKIRSKVVCEESFSYAARTFNLGKYLLLGKGEDSFGGRNRNSILADTFEALFGALYLDGGMDVVTEIANKYFFDTVVYKIDKNIKLATYASRCIENEILMYLRKNNKIRYEISLDEPLNIDYDGNELLLGDIVGTDDDLVEQEMLKSDQKKIFYEALKELNEREKEILILRYGLSNNDELTQKDVADLLGISQSYISRLEKKIIKKLRSQLNYDEVK